MYENDIAISSYPVDTAALVLSLYWGQVFSGCVGDYFLSGCVMFCSAVAVCISNMPGMMSRLIVIALGVKAKPTNHCSNLIIACFE